jgi:HEAT repeat protein
MTALTLTDLRALLVVVTLTALVLTALTFGTTWVGARKARRGRLARDAWLARVRLHLDAVDPVGDPGSRDAPPQKPALEREVGPGFTTVSRLSTKLSGQAAGDVAAASDEPTMLEQARKRCASRLWWRRLQGMRMRNLLHAAEPDATALLFDPHPAVRAETAPWVAAHPTPAGIEALVTMLGDDSPRCRTAAAEALTGLGRRASASIREHLEAAPAASELLLQVAARNPSADLLASAVRAAHDPNPGIRLGGTSLLGAIGGEEACRVLAGLLHDPDERVRAHSAERLGQLEQWRSARALAELLDDPEWLVRRAAAGSLRALGPAGRAQLRRALGDRRPGASDIARHVLDLPTAALESLR